jgi:hypothetical protein
MPLTCELCHLVKLEITKAFRLYVRYRFEAVFGVGFLIAIYIALAVGVSVAKGSGIAGFGATSDGLLIGYLCWAIAVGGTSSIGSQLEDDARTGVLEAIFLSGYSIVKILVARSLGSLLAGLPVVVLLVTLLVLLSGKQYALQAGMLPPLILLDVCATGLGLVIASGALIFKRIRFLLVATQLLVIFLVMLPNPMDGQWLRVLPISTQVWALREAIHIGHMPAIDEMLPVVLNAGAYLLLGVAILYAAVRHAKLRGQLAHY